MAEKAIRTANARYSRIVVCLVAILVISSAVYIHTTGYGFLHWDDMTHIVRDEYAHGLSPHNMTGVFQPLETTDYQPVRYIYHQILYSVFGLERPGVYHLGNIILKAILAALGFLVLRQILLTFWQKDDLLLPFFGALFFSLHPLTVEPTAWCIGVKELLAGLFYLGALYFFVLFLQDNRRRMLVLTGVCLLLSLLSKASAVSFPFVAGVLMYYHRSKLDRKMVAWTLGPMLILAVAVAGLNLAAYAESRVIGDISTQDRIANVGTIMQSSVPVYVRNLILPIFTSPVYDQYRSWRITDPRFLVSCLFCLALVGVLVRLLWQRRKVGIFVGFFVLSSLPAFAFQTHILTADRYIFLPTFSAMALLALLLFEFGKTVRGRWIATIVAVLLCVFYAKTTVSYSQCFRSDKALFERAMKIASHNPTAFSNYASTLRSEGNSREAVRPFQRAAELDPDHFNSRSALGKIFAEFGDFPAAARYFQEAYEIRPESAEINWRLGRMRNELGELEAALGHFDRALLLDSSLEEAYYCRGALQYAKSQFDEAEADFQKARQINPNRADTHFCLGTISAEVRGDLAKAREFFETAAKLDPRNPRRLLPIARTFEREGNFQEARRCLLEIFELNPDDTMKATVATHLERIERELAD